MDIIIPIKIKLIISNNENSKGLVFAKKFSIPFLIINTKKRNYELLILKKIKKYNISLICLAGYMKIVSRNFLSMYRKKIINIHPSLLPSFKGIDAIRQAIDYGVKISGLTTHYINEELDSGEIIKQKEIVIEGLTFEEIDAKFVKEGINISISTINLL